MFSGALHLREFYSRVVTRSRPLPWFKIDGAARAGSDSSQVAYVCHSWLVQQQNPKARASRFRWKCHEVWSVLC